MGLLAGAAVASAEQNYIVVDNQSGYILASSGADEKVQVGSLTKIATAMVALDWAQLNKVELGVHAVVSARAMNAGGLNPVGLQEGDEVSLRDLLYSALIASDNIAATALAEYVGARLPNATGLDATDNFVAHMNALARTLNMRRTLFLNPSGFDGYDKGALPHSTAADMARLTQYAYSEADFPFYVSQDSRVVHIFRNAVDMPIELHNTNELLGQNDIDGVKTGRTNRAGDCVILSAEQKPEVQRDGDKVLVTPRRIIVVLLGSNNRFGVGLALMQKGWDLYDKWAAGGRKFKTYQTLEK